MNKPLSIGIFAETDAQRTYFAELVRLAGFDAILANATGKMEYAAVLCGGDDIGPFKDSGVAIVWLSNTPKASVAGVRAISVPARAAIVVQALRDAVGRQLSGPSQVEINGGLLDVRENLWMPFDGDGIRLTEKETALLMCLHGARGATVSRQMLLDKVWSYAEGVETHTLETHIYRLRQKIEIDPSLPKILLTQEDGYSLAL